MVLNVTSFNLLVSRNFLGKIIFWVFFFFVSDHSVDALLLIKDTVVGEPGSKGGVM